MDMKFACTFLAELWGFVINGENIYIGIDPQWSVRLAFKWCEHPEWVHVNTTLLFSLVCDCGSMFGLAVATPIATS
jgi:glucose-6-phosphatase